MKLNVELTTEDLKRLVINELRRTLNDEDFDLDDADVRILVRSNQNYRNKEWEVGEFKAVVEKST